MRRIAVFALSAFLMASATPAIAGVSQDKETCQISANTCLNKADILQKRIKKLFR